MRFALSLSFVLLIALASCIETKTSQSPFRQDFGLAANLEHGARLTFDSMGVAVEIVNAGPGNVWVEIPGSTQELAAGQSMHTSGRAGVISNPSGQLACLRVIQPEGSEAGVRMEIDNRR